jgi:ribonuclease E
MKRDRAKVDISRISRFGLLQISRQKLGSPIESGNYRICEHCRGRGTVRSVETMALFYLRRIHTGASRKPVVKIDCRFPLDVAQYLLNNKRQEIMELEEKYDAKVIITADPSLKPSEHEIAFGKAEKEEPEKKTGLS